MMKDQWTIEIELKKMGYRLIKDNYLKPVASTVIRVVPKEKNLSFADGILVSLFFRQPTDKSKILNWDTLEINPPELIDGCISYAECVLLSGFNSFSFTTNDSFGFLTIAESVESFFL